MHIYSTPSNLSLSRRSKLSRFIKHLPGLLAYYPLDEANGLTAFNRAPGKQGTLDGTISGATIGQPGKVGNAYSFDGINDQISFSGPAFGTAGSIGFLCKLDTSIKFMYLFDCTNGNRYLFYQKNTGADQWGWYINGAEIADSSPITTLISHQTYTFVILTWDNSLSSAKEKVYKNGSLNTTRNASITNATPTNLWIGRSFNDTSPLNGLLQHFFICNVALSANQAAKIAKLSGLS